MLQYFNRLLRLFHFSNHSQSRKFQVVSTGRVKSKLAQIIYTDSENNVLCVAHYITIEGDPIHLTKLNVLLTIKYLHLRFEVEYPN